MDQAQARFWSTDAPGLLQQLQVPPEGLSVEEASRRLSQYGPNLLKPPTRSGPLWLLLGQFKSPIILILIFAAGLSFYLEHLVELGRRGTESQGQPSIREGQGLTVVRASTHPT